MIMRIFNIVPKAELLTKSLIERKKRQSKSGLLRVINKLRYSTLLFVLPIPLSIVLFFAAIFNIVFLKLCVIVFCFGFVICGFYMYSDKALYRGSEESDKKNSDFFISIGLLITVLAVTWSFVKYENLEFPIKAILLIAYVFFMVQKVMPVIPEYKIKTNRVINCIKSVEAVLTDIESGNKISAVDVTMPKKYMYNECKNYEYVYHYGDNDYCLSLYNKVLFISRYGSSVTIEIDPDSPECFNNKDIIEPPEKKEFVYHVIIYTLLAIIFTAVALFMLKYGLSGLFE